jgi:hypothetical protein
VNSIGSGLGQGRTFEPKRFLVDGGSSCETNDRYPPPMRRSIMTSEQAQSIDCGPYIFDDQNNKWDAYQSVSTSCKGKPRIYATNVPGLRCNCVLEKRRIVNVEGGDEPDALYAKSFTE